MRFYHIIYRNSRPCCFFILSLLFSESIGAGINTEKTGETIGISLKVVDENGNPISNAIVRVGENVIAADPDELGVYSFGVKPQDVITLSAPGFEKKVSSGQDMIHKQSITLQRSDLFNGPGDIIPLPYLTVNKRHATGSYNVIKGKDLLKYPSTDLRLSFVGQTPGLLVTEHHGAPGAHPTEQRGFYGFSNKVSIAARGRNLTYVIDGIPANITEIPLDPGEIESVTVIKDIVGKAMYGPLGADGIMFIKTRRGRENESFLNVSVESGTSTIDRFPEWASGAEYASLNNLAREADGLSPSYSSSDIAEYAKNDPYSLKYPSVDYQDYMFKNNREFQRASISAGGWKRNSPVFPISWL